MAQPVWGETQQEEDPEETRVIFQALDSFSYVVLFFALKTIEGHFSACIWTAG